MKVSIIVPGFGKGRQLAEAQAVRLGEIVGENAEVLVPNGSNVSEARNRGLEMAKGDWIAWVDADDEVAEDWFPEICRAIDAAEQDGAIDNIVFDMVRVRGARETVSRYGRAAAVESKVLVDDLLRDMRLGNYAWLHVTRRRLWENERFEPLAVLEDYVTLPRILSRARKVLYIAKPLYRHIEHTGGLCGSADKSVFFAIAVERATRFGSPAALGACVAAYDGIYDRTDRNGAARRWIRRHLLQALCDREVPLKWKMKFTLAAVGIVVRRPGRFVDWVRACLKWIFKAEMWSAHVRYPDGRTVRLPMDRAKYDFCADPFLFRQGGANWLFYETLGKGRKGEIGCFKEENGAWVNQGTVLELPCHLSYPQVFEQDGRIFMIPETYDFFKGSVDLYEATDFPRGWKKVRTLIPEPAVDATLLRTGGHFYLFCTFIGEHPHADLRVADSLFGEWHLHPQSGNVNQTDRLRRCAGRIQAHGGRLYRIVQDCEGEYGRRVFRIPILEIGPETYREGAAELLLEGGHTYNELETPEGLLTAYDIKRFDPRPLGESIRLMLAMIRRKFEGLKV